jgi:hypothetical protein
VLIGVVLTSLVGVMAGMRSMAMSDVGMVCRGFVFSGVVMLGGFTMVMSGLRVMFRSVSVVFRSLVLHLFFPCCNSTYFPNGQL